LAFTVKFQGSPRRHIVAVIDVIFMKRSAGGGGPVLIGGGQKTGISRRVASIAVVLGLGALSAACFQPLYGRGGLAEGDSVRDKFGAIEITDIAARKGTPASRVAVALRNALVSDLNGGANPTAPLYRLNIGNLSAGKGVLGIDVATGNADSELEQISVTFTLTEIATNKVVLSDSSFATASLDIPGSVQIFAEQRAARNAEDRATEVLAQNIKNRLASYFVAGT